MSALAPTAGMQDILAVLLSALSHVVLWPRELNSLQLKKTHAKKQKKQNTSILRKRLHEFDNTCCKYSKHNQVQKHSAKLHKRPKYRNVRQIQVTNVIFNV